MQKVFFVYPFQLTVEKKHVIIFINLVISIFIKNWSNQENKESMSLTCNEIWYFLKNVRTLNVLTFLQF